MGLVFTAQKSNFIALIWLLYFVINQCSDTELKRNGFSQCGGRK